MHQLKPFNLRKPLFKITKMNWMQLSNREFKSFLKLLTQQNLIKIVASTGRRNVQPLMGRCDYGKLDKNETAPTQCRVASLFFYKFYRGCSKSCTQIRLIIITCVQNYGVWPFLANRAHNGPLPGLHLS